ncbi:unnamed protein product, partial [Pylaiella littoralis]
ETFRVTPADTRSGAQRGGVPGALALLAAEEDLAQALARSDAALSGVRNSRRDLQDFVRRQKRTLKPTLDRTVAYGRRERRNSEEQTSSRQSRIIRKNLMSLVVYFVLTNQPTREKCIVY